MWKFSRFWHLDLGVRRDTNREPVRLPATTYQFISRLNLLTVHTVSHASANVSVLIHIIIHFIIRTFLASKMTDEIIEACITLAEEKDLRVEEELSLSSFVSGVWGAFSSAFSADSSCK